MCQRSIDITAHLAVQGCPPGPPQADISRLSRNTDALLGFRPGPLKLAQPDALTRGPSRGHSPLQAE